MGTQRRYFQMTLDAIDRFEKAESYAVLGAEIQSTIARFGYRHFCFVSAGAIDRKFSDRVLLNSWPKGWLEQYVDGGFYPHDPVAAAIRASIDAFCWGDVRIPEDPKAKTLMSIAADDFRMREGFCVPIHGLHGFQAAVSLAGTDIEDANDARAAVELVTIYAYNRIAKLRTPPPKSLTNREREVVSWIAAGKSAWDTGGILRIAEDTVNKHIKSAMRKLDVHTRAQAVAESIRRGEIAL